MAGNLLSAFHVGYPEVKGNLRESWYLFKCWGLAEQPSRAPPLSPELTLWIVAHFLAIGSPEGAFLTALVFECLLRGGEFLSLQFQDIAFDDHGEAAGAVKHL